jgi:hypothetical protein
MGVRAKLAAIRGWQFEQSNIKAANIAEQLRLGASSQNISFIPNWMLRGGIEVLTIRPKLLAAKFNTGLPKTTRFNGFCISMRN